MIDPTLPLTDLHRHLDGNVRLQTILDLAAQHRIPLPGNTLETLRPYVEVDDSEPGLIAFLERFKYLTAILVDYEACRRIGYENVLDLQNEGIDYAELRFSPWFMAKPHGLEAASVVAAVAAGVAAGREETGINCQLIGILTRSYGAAVCALELDALLSHREHLVAIDLAGDEAGFPGRDFREHFARARDAGLNVTVHAGEADGAHSVRTAVDELGATRIGHGFQVLEDPALVEELAERQIGFEVCITSNVQISAVNDIRQHPVTEMMQAGLRANLNTDDPSISGIDLAHEYHIAAPKAGLTPDQIRQAQINGLEMAFLSPEQKQALRDAKAGSDPLGV